MRHSSASGGALRTSASHQFRGALPQCLRCSQHLRQTASASSCVDHSTCARRGRRRSRTSFCLDCNACTSEEYNPPALTVLEYIAPARASTDATLAPTRRQHQPYLNASASGGVHRDCTCLVCGVISSSARGACASGGVHRAGPWIREPRGKIHAETHKITMA